jgi:hypothetical protein
MTVALDPVESALAALESGHIVIMRCRCGPSIQEAREASRRASARLERKSVFTRGQLSRSAAPGMGIVAVQLHFPVGVDIEVQGGFGTATSDTRDLLHPTEGRSVAALPLPDELSAIWVRKEAVLKAFGVGLAIAPGGLLTGGRNESWRQVAHRGLGMAWLRSLDAPAGFDVAVATRAPQPPPLLWVDVDL